MLESTVCLDGFPSVSGKKVEIDFNGGHVSSLGGSVLLRQIDDKIGLTSNLRRSLVDKRQRRKISHPLLSLLRQRIYGIACGWEDLNDHDELRHDYGLQTAVGRTEELASSATLCRLENAVDREWIYAAHEALFQTFVSSYEEAPKELILDFDASDIPIHGDQELKQFHGYYDNYCYLPLYVFCGDHLLACYLRPSRIDGAKHSGAILKLLVNHIRKEWPQTKIIFRGDGGFCREFILKWCERNNVDYIVGIARNKRLEQFTIPYMSVAREQFDKYGEKQVIFSEMMYAAKTWKRERRCIIKAEYSDKGSNPRFLLTSLEGDPEELYRKIYCSRGDAENRIKEQQLDLFGIRTSATHFIVNQFRILLSGLAYTLIKALKRLALDGTKLGNAYCATIREKLFNIGAVITRNTRRVRIHLSSASPMQETFIRVWKRLSRLQVE